MLVSEGCVPQEETLESGRVGGKLNTENVSILLMVTVSLLSLVASQFQTSPLVASQSEQDYRPLRVSSLHGRKELCVGGYLCHSLEEVWHVSNVIVNVQGVINGEICRLLCFLSNCPGSSFLSTANFLYRKFSSLYLIIEK